MKTVLKFISLAGLIFTIYPPVLYFMGDASLDRMKLTMGIGMVLWMVTAPFWINKKKEDGRSEAEQN
ncbi:hypothetical protein [Algoriphagus sanaruensis]|uniref:Uncharacterized protein n=1 Tax=Algoriphagus sanaruensis TaxID=1727163 RepID=A0A142ERM9_9BACT|nr:hypothetical protein [Algoriphagus sanaruensis]AMQ57784.1 hypothetical protein AO498_15120 [Algoriphagus sanaruensis]